MQIEQRATRPQSGWRVTQYRSSTLIQRMCVTQCFVMQRLAFYQRVREQQSAERFVAQRAHCRPCAAQVFGDERAVREYHRLIVGIQEHFARVGELLRRDTQQGGFVRRDARQAGAHLVRREAGAAVLDALGKRTAVAQSGGEIGFAT